MAIKEYFYYRSWAESVRLYSGLLEPEERKDFIIELADKDVLLASECKSIVASEEPEIVKVLANIALRDAKRFHQSKISAKGFLALSELEKFDEISNIFSANRSKTLLHLEVISNFILSGSELQIITMLKILVDLDRRLLIRALDKVFEKDVFFAQNSKRLLVQLIHDFHKKEDFFVVGKLLLIIKKRVPGLNVGGIVTTLLDKQQVNNAKLVSHLFSFVPTSSNQFEHFLDHYIESQSSEDKITDLLSLLESWGCQISEKRLAIAYSNHLNPKVRNKHFYNTAKMDEDTIRKVVENQIALGKKSSLEFAIQLLKEFDIFNSFPIERIVDTLLERLTVPRLRLAIDIIEEFSLFFYYPKPLVFAWIINTNFDASYSFAIEFIKNNFTPDRQLSYFFHILAILENKFPKSRFIRKILFEEINQVYKRKDVKIGEIYYGYVSHLYKGFYSVHLGQNEIVVSIPKKQEKLPRRRIIEARITNIDANEKFHAHILNKYFSERLRNDFFWNGAFLGQILTCKVTKVSFKQLFVEAHLETDKKAIRGFISINQIGHEFISNLKDQYQGGEFLKSKIIGFDRRNNNIIFSAKAMIPKPRDQSQSLSDLSENAFKEKLKKLQDALNS